MSIWKECALILFLIFAIIVPGCLTYSFGDTVYGNDTLRVRVHNSGDAQRVTLQVTIFDTTDFEQKEVYKKAEYFTLEKGENEYTVPVHLEPGSYKVYLYIIVDDKRTNLEIRDLEV
ncbi:MAG: hypothetical protein RQ758_07770 [Methanomicrobiaceae archaeon]|nr:hypothetical protein [Methanomicrobiaceae archaeon]